MRIRPTLLSLCLLLVGGAFAQPAVAQYGPGARIWVENDRDYFRTGDRLRVNFSTRANSYVAVIHVDPDGYLEFLYPSSPWDSEYVRGGFVHDVDRSGWSNGLLVRGRGGIGYLYIVASPVPLDYSRFQVGRGGGWDWSYAGRQVVGDPFWAMEQITRSLLPGWHNVPYAADYYTYYVGGRHAYPSYACSRPAGGWGWGYSQRWSSYYGACNRLDQFLLDDPYYFDSRRYRGDRWRYYRDYRDERDWDPRHAYKADPRAPAPPPAQRRDGPASNVAPANPAPGAREPLPQAPPAQRPSATPRNEAPARPARPQPARERPAGEAAPAQRDRSPEPSRPAATPAPRERAAPARAPAAASRGTTVRPRETAGGGSSSSTPRARRGD